MFIYKIISFNIKAAFFRLPQTSKKSALLALRVMVLRWRLFNYVFFLSLIHSGLQKCPDKIGLNVSIIVK